jgi:hypothetical protein
MYITKVISYNRYHYPLMMVQSKNINKHESLKIFIYGNIKLIKFYKIIWLECTLSSIKIFVFESYFCDL